jgi:hypothetical protein
MLLQTVLDHLKTGDLSLSNLGGNDEDGVYSNNTKQIINHINLGMIDIYKRFNLSLKEIYVDQYAHIQKYNLNKKHALSNKESTLIKYISDTEDDPFQNDILQIVDVANELGCSLPLNNSNECNSLFTPKYNVIQNPCPVDGNTIIVIYRAAPELLTVSCDADQELDLPVTFLEPLLYFVAYRIKAARPDQESLIESNSYFNKYLAGLDLIKAQGLYASFNTTNLKLIQRGFS